MTKKTLVILGGLTVVLIAVLCAGCTGIPSIEQTNHEFDIVGTWSGPYKSITASEDHTINVYSNHLQNWKYISDGFYDLTPKNDYGTIYIKDNTMFICGILIYKRVSGLSDSIIGKWSAVMPDGYEHISVIYELKEDNTINIEQTENGEKTTGIAHWTGTGKINDKNYYNYSNVNKEIFSDGKYMAIERGGDRYKKIL